MTVKIDPYTKLDKLAVKLPCQACTSCCCNNCAAGFGYQSADPFWHDPLGSARTLVLHDVGADVGAIQELRWSLERATRPPEQVAEIEAQIAARTYDLHFNVLGVNYTFNTRWGFYSPQTGCQLPRVVRSSTCLGYLCWGASEALGEQDYHAWHMAYEQMLRQRCGLEDQL